MIKARYTGENDYIDLTVGKEYVVKSVDLLWTRVPFLRITDDFGEDYLFPWNHFEITEGRKELMAYAKEPRRDIN